MRAALPGVDSRPGAPGSRPQLPADLGELVRRMMVRVSSDLGWDLVSLIVSEKIYMNLIHSREV